MLRKFNYLLPFVFVTVSATFLVTFLVFLVLAVAPSAGAVGDGVHLQPGEEVNVYCSGTAAESENIDDLTIVARCLGNDEAVYSPAIVADD